MPGKGPRARLLKNLDKGIEKPMGTKVGPSFRGRGSQPASAAYSAAQLLINTKEKVCNRGIKMTGREKRPPRTGAQISRAGHLGRNLSLAGSKL